jgi:hypothetical protein
MAHSATTINENGICWQYAVARRVVQRSSTLLALESPWMSLTRDALWHNGMSPPRKGRAREGDSPYQRVLDHTSWRCSHGRAASEMLRFGCT